jgi:hypothetical protein
MDLWMTCLAEVQAVTVLLSDWPTKPMDAVFFHARSHGDDDGLFELAAEFLNQRLARRVVINGSDGERADGTGPGTAWPGKKVWLDRLKDFGITPFLTRPAFHNRDENEAFQELAEAERWKSAVILTQPHQILRTFLGAVKSMADHRYWMRLHAAAPRATPWWKKVHGSQGAEELARFQHIEAEFKRVPLYQQKGDLATLPELWAYLQSRESIA